MNKLYWESKEEEEEMIAGEEFAHHLIEIRLMYEEDFKSGQLKISDFLEQKKEKPKIKPTPLKYKGTARKIIDEKIKISEVAKHYGLEVKNNKMKCPFHDDKDPSLSLNDVGNCFYCFGCHTSGDVIDFIWRLKKWDEKRQQLKH